MDNYKHLILIKGEPKDDVVICYYDKVVGKCAVTFKNNPKTYYYNYNNVIWMNVSDELDVSQYRFSTKEGKKLFDIKKILVFKDDYDECLRFFYNDGYIKSYYVEDLNIQKNIATIPEAKSLMDYFCIIADRTGLISKDGKNILKSRFESLDFISDDSVLAKYLCKSNAQEKSECSYAIFPFGCNLSQMTAVKNALGNQISIIEGPPGTGKTQTILNIIANVVMRGQTVAVVSNNNSATDNVFEKLEKNGYDYIAAQLGCTENKVDFILNKQKEYPDFSGNELDIFKKIEITEKVKSSQARLTDLFKAQNKISQLKRDLSALTLEKKHFEEFFKSTYSKEEIFRPKAKLNSDKILKIWNELQSIIEKKKSVDLFFKLKAVLFYKFDGFDVLKLSPVNIIEQLKRTFYDLKLSEIENEIQVLEEYLKQSKADELMAELNVCSNILFKSSLADTYSKNTKRRNFMPDDLWKKGKEFLKEYPVILSTTYSAKSSLKGITYDYIIVDEASQVDLATGVLAMSCANNIVIVGDMKQLPNVITKEVKNTISQISDYNKISNEYRYEQNSLLSSACQVFKDAPRTLLREHYRCHPKIIEFCNQKFYNNQLIVMTTDNGETDVLKAHITTEGNHARGHVNQRQIDEIKNVVLPELDSTDVGIISPYKAQTSSLNKEITDQIEVSTVHKFQGREKNDIIISTVDNEISQFTDDPNMLNVAVSRAKNRLRVVVSNNENNAKTNIGDLVRYIQYNNFEIKQSDIYSVFDMLYKSFDEKRKEFLKDKKRISEYDSENLMYAVITDVLNADEFSKLDVISHQPLNAIICDPHKLTDNETAYAMNPMTHVDFLVYNTIDKTPVLAIEVDGYAYHNNDIQFERDQLKNVILEKYNIPLIRFSTTGSMEKEKLIAKLKEIV